MRTIGEKLQPGFLTSLDEFTAAISRDASFYPYGELIHSYDVSKGKSFTITFESLLMLVSSDISLCV
jgi:Histone acetyl transferase HAT1 N-terminus